MPVVGELVVAAPWRCELCFAGWRELGEIVSGLSVITDGVSWALLGGQGHAGDELVVWDAAPTPDPVTPAVISAAEAADAAGVAPDAEVVAAFEAADAWLDAASATKIDLDLRSSWQLVERLRAGGYDPNVDGAVELWLFDRAGRLAAAG